MRTTALLAALPLLAACGGSDTRPRLEWQASTLTVTSTTTATMRLRVIPGKDFPMPAGDWVACINATWTSGANGPKTNPFCVTFRDCDTTPCAADVTVDGAFAGGTAPAGLGTVYTSFTARGPGGMDASGTLLVTQTP